MKMSLKVRMLHLYIECTIFKCIPKEYYTPLEMRPQIRSKEQLKCMYSECLDGIGGFKDFKYHIELDPDKPRVQTST